MRLIERFVMIELLRVFGSLITVSTCMLVFVGVFDEARKLGLGTWQALQIMPFVIPSLMPYTIPATLLLSVCVVYGRMSATNEVIAARAAGIHIMHLMWPSFCLAAVLSVVSLVLTDQVIPWSFGSIERIAAMAMEDIFLEKLRAESFINAKEYGFTINVTGVRGRTLIHPTIRYMARGGHPITMQANELHIQFDQIHQVVKLAIRGAQGKFAENNHSFYLENEELRWPLPKKNGSAGNRVKRTQDLLVSLQAEKERKQTAHERQAVEAAFALSRGDFDHFQSTKFNAYRLIEESALDQIRGIRTDYYTRFSMSVSCLFFVLLGSPFAILMAKKEFLTSFLYCFMPILVVYYPIAMMTQNLSKSGQLDPAWSSWLANVTLLIAALYFIRRVMRN